MLSMSTLTLMVSDKPLLSYEIFHLSCRFLQVYSRLRYISAGLSETNTDCFKNVHPPRIWRTKGKEVMIMKNL